MAVHFVYMTAGSKAEAQKSGKRWWNPAWLHV